MNATPTAHDHTTHDHPTPTLQTNSIVGKRTANITLETPLLGAAVAGLLAGVLALPDVALILLGIPTAVLLGIPTAVLLGVGTITTAARVLAR